MEELEKDPEEIPMEDVLAEIRRMLTAKVESDSSDSFDQAQKNELPKDEVVSAPVIPQESFGESPNVASKIDLPEDDDYFLLTPAMRCDSLFNHKTSEQVKLQTQKVLHKLGQRTEKDRIPPELEAWLNKNLPEIVERAVAKQMAKRSA